MPAAGCARAERGIALRAGCALDHDGVVRGPVDAQRIALVFTGGDYGEGGPAILAALRERDVRASFFVTGQFLAAPERRALVQAMAAAGHYVGPHSHAHLLYCDWNERATSLVTQRKFAQDLTTNIADLQRLGALQPPTLRRPLLFIPPFEWYNAEQVAWARELHALLFNFTPGSGSNRDWIPEGQRGFVPSAQIAADILAYERQDPHGLRGFILLLHLGSQRQDKMHPHVGPLLDELHSRGYQFVRIDELLCE